MGVGAGTGDSKQGGQAAGRRVPSVPGAHGRGWGFGSMSWDL